jgi:hypothetical protein
MKRFVLVSAIIIGLFVVSACAPSLTYVVTMKNGETYEAKSEPVVNKETGYLEYLDEDDKKVRLKEEDVILIKEK